MRRRSCVETETRTSRLSGEVRTQDCAFICSREEGRFQCEGGTTWWRIRSATGRLTPKPSRLLTRRRGACMLRLAAPHLIRGWSGFTFTHGSFFYQSRSHGVVAVRIRMCLTVDVRLSDKVPYRNGFPMPRPVRESFLITAQGSQLSHRSRRSAAKDSPQYSAVPLVPIPWIDTSTVPHITCGRASFRTAAMLALATPAPVKTPASSRISSRILSGASAQPAT